MLKYNTYENHTPDVTEFIPTQSEPIGKRTMEGHAINFMVELQ